MISKPSILFAVRERLEHQISQLSMEIASIAIEMSNESKSSAGDKFETAREMMKQSSDRLTNHLYTLNSQLNAVLEMSNSKSSSLVKFGSLVETNHGWFLFGVSLGKIIVEQNSIFLLSLNSPIGKTFLNRKGGDSFSFMDKSYSIKSIL